MCQRGYGYCSCYQSGRIKIVRSDLNTDHSHDVQVIDGLPAPRNKEEILNDFEQLNQEADELDAKLRNEIIQSEQLLGSIRHSLRSVTKRKDD